MLGEETHLSGLGGTQLHHEVIQLDRPGGIVGGRPGPSALAIKTQVGRNPGGRFHPGAKGSRVWTVDDAAAERLEASAATEVDQTECARGFHPRIMTASPDSGWVTAPGGWFHARPRFGR